MKPSPTPKDPVLILDGDMVPALTIARSLGRLGNLVLIGSHEPDPLAGRSRHVAQSLRYPDPLSEADAFVDWVAQWLDSHPTGLVIPVTERSLVPLHRQRDRLSAARVAMAPAPALDVVLDKAQTMALARSLGIRVPLGCAPDALGPALAFAAAHGYPLVIKPAASIGNGDRDGDHRRVQLSVTYATNANQLACGVNQALRHGGVLVQELFRGVGVGIELIADHGELRYAFQHRRHHEVPLTGGGSSLRESVPVRPTLLDASRRLMAALGWNGVAMVEFKEDPASGDFCLMEINGRFWGSLPLALAAGADFPAMALELLRDGRVTERAPARTGVYCRHLQKDLYWHELLARREAPAGLATLPKASRVARDLLLVFSPRHHFDVQTLSDLRPSLRDVSDILAGYRTRITDLLAQRRLLRRQRAAWRDGRIAAALGPGAKVLFLCYGNINRSPLAEQLARRRLGDALDLESAGLHAVVDRPADATMVAVASAHGHDLSASRSRLVSVAMLEAADLILVMEPAHLRALTEISPASAHKAFLLGPVAPNAVPEGIIADPYGQPKGHYERCFEQIQGCVDALADLVLAGHDANPPPLKIKTSRAL